MGKVRPGHQKLFGLLRRFGGKHILLASSALAAMGAFGLSFALAAAQPGAGADAPLVRPYDLDDPRFCWMTPEPFICRRCLSAGQQFVQILSFDAEDGRPLRRYECRAYTRPYIE